MYHVIALPGGIETEQQYPYNGRFEKCFFNKTKAKIDINGGINITSNETGKFALRALYGGHSGVTWLFFLKI